MSKRLKLLLIGSLVLNALLVSFIGGKIYSHKMTKPGFASLVTLLENSSIPEDERSALISRLVQSSADRKGAMKNNRTWGDKTQAILTAEDFDRAAYRAQLEERFLSKKPHKAEMIGTMVEIATALNQEERVEMARILKRQSKRGSQHRRIK